jgi:phage replication O-like protein O
VSVASPQLEDGYTKIANEILENLARLHMRPNQWRILICIFRKVYGYNKKEDYITNSQIVLDTGLKKEVVSRAITDMVERYILIRDKKVVGFQKDWEQWKLTESSTVESCRNRQPELSKSSTKVDGPPVTQKKKETYTKEKVDFLNSYSPAFKETFRNYKTMRTKIKKPMTDKAIGMALTKLKELSSSEEGQIAILNQSIFNSWAGVFPLTGQLIKEEPKKVQSTEEYFKAIGV